MLDAGVQVGSASSRLHDVSHIEDFNIAFTGVVGLDFGGSRGIQARGDEGRAVQRGLGGLGAACISGRQEGLAIGASADVGRPHVAGRQEDLEVIDVVRVGGAAEAHLHGLALRLIGVDDGQQRAVAVLGGEVGHHQHVARTGIAELQIGGSGTSQAGDGVCATSETGDQGRNAQSENIFLHKYSS